MLRKASSSAANHHEDDTVSIESSENNNRHHGFPNGETLVIPVGENNNNNNNNNNNSSSYQPPSSSSPPKSSSYDGNYPPPPQQQIPPPHHYGGPPPHHHHYSHPHAPPPQQGYGGYYYNNHHPNNNNNNNNNSINFKVVAVALLTLMAVLHLTRPQTAIIQIDPNSAVLRHAVNSNGQMYAFDAKNAAGGGGMYTAESGNGGGGGFSGSVENVMSAEQQQQQLSSSASSQMMGGTSSSFLSNAVPSTGTVMQAETSTSFGSNGMDVTNTEGMEGGTAEAGQQEIGAFEEEGSTQVVVEGEDSTVGLYGETTSEQDLTTTTAALETPIDGEEGRLPGTLPGTGQVDLSLSELDHFKDAWDPYELSDNAVFWHIPKAGGSTVKDVIGTCHRFVMATEFGVTDGHENDPEIAVVYPGGGPVGQDRSPFVNVDTTTIEGIERAKQMGFADSGLADAIVTPFIYEANELFTPTAKGRLFTVFRHPIDRAISLFYYIQVADWEPTYNPDLVNWSIDQYAKSDIIENNWMTRQLTNQLEGDLNDDHLALAMEVIRRKFLVGLMTQIERTVERFERFFRWTYHVNPPNQEACRERLLTGGSNKNASGNKKEKPEEGSEAYELLRMQNVYDLQLYEYIESLFEEQEEFVQDIPADFRNIDATCCKCFPPTFPPEGFDCPLAILN